MFETLPFGSGLGEAVTILIHAWLVGFVGVIWLPAVFVGLERITRNLARS